MPARWIHPTWLSGNIVASFSESKNFLKVPYWNASLAAYKVRGKYAPRKFLRKSQKSGFQNPKKFPIESKEVFPCCQDAPGQNFWNCKSSINNPVQTQKKSAIVKWGAKSVSSQCSLTNTAARRSYPTTKIRSLTVCPNCGKRCIGCAKEIFLLSLFRFPKGNVQ